MNTKFVKIEVLDFEKLLILNSFGVVCVEFMVGEWGGLHSQ
jgi:hypothetical protein